MSGSPLDPACAVAWDPWGLTCYLPLDHSGPHVGTSESGRIGYWGGAINYVASADKAPYLASLL